MTADDPSRLRVHPERRFAAPVVAFSLNDAVAELRRERGGGQHGHRQKALYRHGPTTVALFDFDEGAALTEHAADGAVVIQALNGRLEVRADGRTHRLDAGALLAMAPGVPHEVRALQPSSMLLTVSLERPATGGNG